MLTLRMELWSPSMPLFLRIYGVGMLGADSFCLSGPKSLEVLTVVHFNWSINGQLNEVIYTITSFHLKNLACRSSKSHLVFDGCLEIGVNIIKTHQNLSYIYRVETQSSKFRNDCWENIQPIENLGGQVKFVYRALQIPQKEIHPGG